MQAALALGNTRDPQSIPHLVAVLKDKTVNVRRAAATALRTMDWRPATSEERALFTIANGRARDAWREGEDAIYREGEKSHQQQM